MAEWVGVSGPYYAVSVPGPPGQENLIGYVLASQVKVVGGSAAPGVPPSAATALGGMPVPNLQQQYANAKENRGAGLNQAVAGVALGMSAQMIVTLLFELEEEGSYESREEYEAAKDRHERASSVRNLAVAGGAALAAFGIGRYAFGWRKMAELEREFPEATTPSLERRYEEAKVKRSLGISKTIWGAVLAGGSWAAAEYVPQLAEPVPEDYVEKADYESALSDREKVVTVRNAAMATGGVLAVWGVGQWVLAEMDLGEVEEVARTMALAVPIQSSGFESPLKVFLGHADARTHLGVQLTW